MVVYIYIYAFRHIDAFIQSDLQCIQVTYCQYVCSLGIEPTNFALLTQCATTEPQVHPQTHLLLLSQNELHLLTVFYFKLDRKPQTGCLWGTNLSVYCMDNFLCEEGHTLSTDRELVLQSTASSLCVRHALGKMALWGRYIDGIHGLAFPL